MQKGFRVQGFWVLRVRAGVRGSGFGVAGLRVQGVGLGVSGFRVGFRAKFRAQLKGVGLRVSGFRVFGFRVSRFRG